MKPMKIKESLVVLRRWERHHPFLGFIALIVFSYATVPILFGTIFNLLWPEGF